MRASRSVSPANCDARHHCYIDDLIGVFGLRPVNNELASRRGQGDKVLVFYHQPAPICAMNLKWAKRVCVQRLADVFNRHMRRIIYRAKPASRTTSMKQANPFEFARS